MALWSSLMPRLVWASYIILEMEVINSKLQKASVGITLGYSLLGLGRVSIVSPLVGNWPSINVETGLFPKVLGPLISAGVIWEGRGFCFLPGLSVSSPGREWSRGFKSLIAPPPTPLFGSMILPCWPLGNLFFPCGWISVSAAVEFLGLIGAGTGWCYTGGYSLSLSSCGRYLRNILW